LSLVTRKGPGLVPVHDGESREDAFTKCRSKAESRRLIQGESDGACCRTARDPGGEVTLPGYYFNDVKLLAVGSSGG
jgi:hypothetical protein